MHQFLSLLFGKLRTKAVLPLVCLTTLLAGNAFATDRYVSATKGSDTNGNGTLDSPYQTIQKAANVAVSGDVVYVMEGTYREQANISVGGVTFRPYNSEKVTIDGTDLLGSWSRVGSSNTWKTTVMDWNFLPATGSNRSYGENQLFQDTTMIDLLRWPKNTSTDVAMPTMAIVESVTFNQSAGTTTIKDSKFTGGSEWVGAQVFVNIAHDGVDGQGWVGKVTAVGTNTITVDFYRDENNGVWSIGPRTEYYLFNPASGKVTDSNVDGLLEKGEWWKDGNTVYVKTRDGSQPNESAAKNIYAKHRYFAFAGDGTASNFTVDGFNLFACSVTTNKNRDLDRIGDASSCSGVAFKNLNIKYVSHQLYTDNYQLEHASWSGVVLDGIGHTVDNCTIRYSATSAISLQGNRHKATNNKIYDTNYMCSTAGVINTGRYNSGSKKSEDLEIGYNLISNTTHGGIYIANLRNSDPSKRGVARVHHNTIVNFMRRSGDSGAIEGGFMDSQWVRVDHNYIYNTFGHDEARNGNQIFGIYFDYGGAEGLIRAIIDHNVITNMLTPVVVNGGTDVDIYNNVLIGSGKTEFNPYNAKYTIGNYSDSGNRRGKNVRIFNNILSHPYNAENFTNATYNNNIEGATVGSQLVTDLFVSPKFTGTSRSINDFKLKDNSVTQAKAIDKGITQGDYSNEGLAAGNIPDIGAFEFGTASTPTLRDADNPASTSAGLDYKYYEGNWSVLPNFDALTAAKQGNVTNFDLTPRNRNDNFGFKFSGYVNVPSDGTYTFYTSSDDGSKLYIGSTEVVSNDFLQDGSVERSGSIGLKAGKHAITVVFFEAGGGQLLTVSYSSSSIAKTTIPASALYRAATSTTATDRTDPVGTGTVTARGQNGTGEGKDKAFDNSKDTKWLDFSATSWIQFQFAGTAKYAVSKYTITSANDEQGRDPRDWKLYGTNVANPSSSELFEVDSQFNVTFDNRYQKKEFTVSSSNTTPYRAYRLVITANKSAGAISIIQLAEVELFAPDCSGCRISAEAESIQQRESLTLQVHPNPTTSEVTISLAGFEEESVVQLQMRDMSGKSFLRRQVQPPVEGKQVSLSVGHLPQGLFFVTVQGSKVAKTAKLIITR